jgi:uncharacterized protein YchJ
MELAQILEQLSNCDGLPIDAIRAARLNKEPLVPKFITYLDAAADGKVDLKERPDLPFFAFHLLGEWREQSACPTLLKFLRSPAAEWLEDEIGITGHRVIVRVFDGDPEPLCAFVLDRSADEFLRTMVLEAIAILTHAGAIGREETSAFLCEIFLALQAEPENFVWFGWQRAISLLGLGRLLPLAKEAFDRGFIDEELFQFRDFEQDFRFAVDHPDQLPPEYAPLDDIIEEISRWQRLSQAEHAEPDDDPPSVADLVLHVLNKDERATLNAMTPTEREAFVARLQRVLNGEESIRESPAQAFNPNRDVGRNDPCPCGSGRKFKKCCLALAA